MKHIYIILITLVIIIFLLIKKNKHTHENLELPQEYVKCADDFELCNNPGVNDVYYGAKNKFLKRKIDGPFKCEAIVFGDPGIEGENCVNSCYIPNIKPKSLPPEYEECAKENQKCMNTGKNVVYYGEKEFYAKEIDGPFTCSVNEFGDPNHGVAKSCYIPTKKISKLPGNYEKCSDENEICSVSGKTKVYFGAGEKFYSQDMDLAFKCNTAQFGDPDSTQKKSCYIPKMNIEQLPEKYKPCAIEGDMCNNNFGESDVYYGTQDKFYKKRLLGPFKCDSKLFGDPSPTQPKACYLPEKQNATKRANFYTKCSDENEICKMKGTHTVYFGSDGKFKMREMTDDFRCNKDIFGDKTNSTRNECYIPKM